MTATKTTNQRQPHIALPLARMAYEFGPGTPDAEAGRKIKQIVREAVEGQEAEGQATQAGKGGGQ